AVVDRSAVKEHVMPHAEVRQLLREVRSEPVEPDQDDSGVRQASLSRWTEQRDLAGVPPAPVCSTRARRRSFAQVGVSGPAFRRRAGVDGTGGRGGGGRLICARAGEGGRGGVAGGVEHARPRGEGGRPVLPTPSAKG